MKSKRTFREKFSSAVNHIQGNFFQDFGSGVTRKHFRKYAVPALKAVYKGEKLKMPNRRAKLEAIARRRADLRSAAISSSRLFGTASPPAAVTSNVHASTISNLTSPSTGATSLLTNALALNRLFGTPAKKTTKLSKHKKSKFARDSSAFKRALSVLCPKLHLHLYTPTPSPMSVGTGVQSVFSGLDVTYCFPLKQFLAQVHYKLSLDIGMAQKSNFFTPMTGAIGDGNQRIPAIDASFIPGGTKDTAWGLKQIANATVSRTQAGDERFNGYPGLIMKYFKRIYTFMNVGTAPLTLQVYEFIKAKGADGEADASVSSTWTDSLTQIAQQNMNFANPGTQQNPTINTLGQVPKKSYKELSNKWRHHKLTTYTIDPQQSLQHTCMLPGTYYSVRDIFQDDASNLVPGKAMSLMFILNGALAFEGGDGSGGAQGTQSGVIGTGTGTLNYKIESECLFQGIIQGQSYVRMYAAEDLTSASAANHALQEPYVIVPAAMERKYEKVESADSAGAGVALDGTPA